MNCVYKPCPAALYIVVQSCCSILSHDTLHHRLSSNSSLENGERELGHLSDTAGVVKTLDCTPQGAIPFVCVNKMNGPFVSTVIRYVIVYQNLCSYILFECLYMCSHVNCDDLCDTCLPQDIAFL